MADKNDAVGNVFKLIKEHDVQFIDFRFTDPKGKWQHTAYSAKKVDKASFEDGIMLTVLLLLAGNPLMNPT